MKDFVENKYPYLLASVVGVILFTALILEGNSHYDDLEYSREKIKLLMDVEEENIKTIFDQQNKIDELQKTIDSLHIFKKR